MSEANLSFGLGGGRLVRRSDSVVFISSESDFAPLVDCVRSVPSGRPVREVVQNYVVEQGFDVPALVVVDWGVEDLVIMLFGDIAVETTARTAPRLSSAGAGTWIEHRVKRSEGVVIQTVGVEPQEYTDLALGLASAGGFELRLTAATGRDRPQRTALGANEAPPATDAVASVPQSAVPRSVRSEGDRIDETPDASIADDFDDVFDRAATAAAVDRTVRREESGSTSRIAELFDAPAVVRSEPASAEQASPVESKPSELVDAQHCDCGALNSPTAMTCRVCGRSLADSERVEAVQRPPVAALRLPDGSTISIASNMELGRNPQGREEFVAIPIDDPEDLVSSHHADLIVESWEMFVVDRGSTNGTEVRQRGQAPIPLDPGVRFLIEVGSTLLLGGLEIDVVAHSQTGSV